MAPQPSARTGFVTWIPSGLVAVAAALLLLQVGSMVVLTGLDNLVPVDFALSVVLTGGFAIVVAGGGIWLGRSDVAPERYPRLAVWCVGVGIAILAINLAMIATWPAATVAQNAGWAIQAATMGAAGGTVLGIVEARAIERARLAERAEVQAENAEAQQEWLAYLNGLLRHEVLNTANVVVGYADLLLEDFDGDEDAHRHVERIGQQSRELTEVIQDVRLLIDASQDGEEAFSPVDLVAVLEDEASTIRDTYEPVSVETSCPEQVFVPADDLLARVFSNVLSNAVEHNDAANPEVEVSVESGPEAVTVRIADNGPGVPEHRRDSLFDRRTGSDHGLGLYLVRTLLDRYGGSIELAETGPDGTVFAIELPRATPEATAISGAGVVTAGSD